MNELFVKSLVTRQEGPKLDFKRKMYAIYDRGEAAAREKDEMIKDILAIANGNPSFAGDEGLLIIGIDDKFNTDGIRDIIGVTGRTPESKELIQLINSACDPRLDLLYCNCVIIDTKTVVIITIPPNPYVHETTRKLKTPKADYSECTVFMRQDEHTVIASHKDRSALQSLKTLHFTQSRKVSPVFFGLINGAFVGGAIAQVLADKVGTTKANKVGVIAGGIITGGFLGAGSGNSYTTIIKAIYELKMMQPEKRPIAIISGITAGFGGAIGFAKITAFVRQKRANQK